MSNGGDRDVSERLRALRVDPRDAGFDAALHRRLVAAGPPKGLGLWDRLSATWRGSRLLWPALGLMTAVAVILGAELFHGGPGVGFRRHDRGALTELPSTKVAVIRVNLTADVAVENARIRVRLPEGLVFWSDGEALAQREFGWVQPLAAGNNEIPIAVRGLRPGRYRVTVTARIGGELVEHDIPLEVVEG